MEKMDTSAFLRQEKFKEKWIQLYQSFETSFQEKSELFSNISFDKISSDFRVSLSHILSLSPDVINVGISNDECVFIYAELGDKSIFFDLFFDEHDQTEVLLNINENKKSICSYSNYIDETLLKLNEFVQIAKYELSDSFITSY
jgi:hypothetical protein